jgi:hypothetical protein
MLPYASASIFPMGMSDYDDARKSEACAAVSARASARFAAIAAALGAPVVIPAGGEYVLGGPVAAQSQFLPQPLEAELAGALTSAGCDGVTIAKLYPGDALDSGAPAKVQRHEPSRFRGFDQRQRADYALTLADRAPAYAQIQPLALEPDWGRLLGRCAAALVARCRKIGYSPALDLSFDVVVYDSFEPLFRYTVQLDDGQAGFALPDSLSDPNRRAATYTLDERLLFSLITGLLNWNAMEASGLLGLSRQPDVYDPDLHRCLVHFTLLS